MTTITNIPIYSLVGGRLEKLEEETNKRGGWNKWRGGIEKRFEIYDNAAIKHSLFIDQASTAVRTNAAQKCC